jgi:hypothetical protein
VLLTRIFRSLRRSVRTALVATMAATLLIGTAGCEIVLEEEGAQSPTPARTGTAEAQLAELTVAKERPMTGYSRKRFPHWRSAGKNCDVRDTVLERDGSDIKVSGCNVIGGTWVSVYDDRTLSDPSEVDIDHMVPLANAWRSGADAWDDTKRGDFANDLDRPQLFAVSASSNRAKGDQNPAQWKPPSRNYWCQYAQDWIAVKHYWELTITAEEKTALTDMLGSC